MMISPTHLLSSIVRFEITLDPQEYLFNNTTSCASVGFLLFWTLKYVRLIFYGEG